MAKDTGGQSVVSGATKQSGSGASKSAQSKPKAVGANLEEQLESLSPQKGIVYRGGSATGQNLTPRNPQDLKGDKRGLSTFEDPAHIKFGNKAQQIDTSKLGEELQAIHNGKGAGDSHVSIRPDTDEKLGAWAETRAEGNHDYTKAVQGAIIKEVKLK